MLRNKLLFCATITICMSSCTTEGDRHDPSIVVDKEPAASSLVENGTAYDRAVVDVGAAKKVILPDTAIVRRTTDAGPVRLFMAKQLGFGGHPPDRASIRNVRKNMGCAVKAEGDALVVTTFGEWDSHIEGGAHMKLVVVVPEGLALEQRTGLAGEPANSNGRAWHRSAPSAEGWRTIPDEPDAERTAQ